MEAALRERRVAVRRADSLARARARDTVRLTRLVRQTDTLTATVTAWKHDTVAVVRYVELADSTIGVCRAVLSNCEQEVGALRAALRAGDDALDASAALRRAPWTAIGLAWDPLSGALGLFAARDLSRLRLGVTALPATPVAPARLVLSVGIRWQ